MKVYANEQIIDLYWTKVKKGKDKWTDSHNCYMQGEDTMQTKSCAWDFHLFMKKYHYNMVLK